MNKFRRVSSAEPCPVCGKADWCLVSTDGNAVICPRVEAGSVKSCGNAGYIHLLNVPYVPYVPSRQVRTRSLQARSDNSNIRFADLDRRYRVRMTDQKLRQLSRTLGLSIASLIRLGLGWDGQAFTFSMRGKRGQVVGIRRRFLSGPKSSVKGSRCGLFIPQGLSGQGPLLICEGPTDTAASLDLGYDAVGRPNCNSGVQELTGIVRGRDIIIIADSDDVGIKGAEMAAKFLMLYCNSLRIFIPPAKDIRQWVRQEVDREYIRHSIENAAEIKMNYNLKTGTKL